MLWPGWCLHPPGRFAALSVPTAFIEHDLPRLHELMEHDSFALLVSQHAPALVASHLPLLLDREAGEFGTLVGHMARANPQWQDLDRQLVLAVFSGPHCYVSPRWYESEHVVPTWNYVAVHAVGRVNLIEDRAQLRPIVRRMVDVYERSMPTPWSMPDEASPFEDRLLDQIVGFRIPIDSIEGKWKLNQNHPEARRQQVARQLLAQGDENSLAIASLFQESFTDKSAVSEPESLSGSARCTPDFEGEVSV